MTTDPRLASLLELTKAAESKESMRLASMSRKIRDLRNTIANLRIQEAEPLDSPFSRACMDANWAAWRNKRIVRLNQELAGLLAQHARQKKTTSRALGRRLVVGKLIEKQG